jgi:hypothetical protein
MAVTAIFKRQKCATGCLSVRCGDTWTVGYTGSRAAGRCQAVAGQWRTVAVLHQIDDKTMRR